MLHPNHYTKREITIGMDEIGRQALRITIPVILIFIVLFFIFWPEMFNLKSFRNAFPDNPFIVIGIVLGGIILHELLHGITWALSCKEGFRA
ncbi:MAG: hypothetical protein ACOC90_09120, partial [Bacteroidota bacterium]